MQENLEKPKPLQQGVENKENFDGVTSSASEPDHNEE